MNDNEIKPATTMPDQDFTEQLSGSKRPSPQNSKRPILGPGERLFQANSPHINFALPDGTKKKFFGFFYATKDPAELKELDSIVATSGGIVIEIKDVKPGVPVGK